MHTSQTSRTTQVSRYEKGKINLDFTGARDSECQWHQLGHMQVCTSLQTDNHVSNPPLIQVVVSNKQKKEDKRVKRSTVSSYEFGSLKCCQNMCKITARQNINYFL